MKRTVSLLIIPLVFTWFFANQVRAIGEHSDKPFSTTNLYYPVAINNKPPNVLFSLEYGRIISMFDYVDSEGEKLDNLLGSTNNHIALGGKMQIRRSNFYLLSTLSYNTYAASGSDNLVGNYYDWKVNYLGTNIGIGYEFFRFSGYRNSPNISEHKGFTLYTQFTAATEFLVQGRQTINNQVYNLRDVEQFDKPFLFARGGLGVVYYASKATSVYLQYLGGKGFSVFKSDYDDQEDLNYITHTISLGIQITLPANR